MRRTICREFTHVECREPLQSLFLQALNGRFLCLAPVSYVSPQKSSNIHAIYHLSCSYGCLSGKLDECSDKLGPIVGNQGESSDRQAPIRSQSGLSLTGDGNLYCSFLLKSSLLSCKTSSSGNLSEPSSTKNLGESSDTEAIHAHFCPNIEPIYHSGRNPCHIPSRGCNGSEPLQPLCQSA